MTISDWIQLSLAVIATIALIVALFGDRFWQFYKRPKIAVEFNPQSERCSRLARPKNEPLGRYFFRLRVINNGKTEAKRLRAKVELFTSKNKGDDFIELSSLYPAPYFEPSTLHWITSLEFVDLAPDEDWYLDLVSQSIEHSLDKPLRIEIFNRDSRGVIWNRTLDKYIIRVIIHGENITKPVIKYFLFNPSTNSENVGSLSEINEIRN